MMFMGMDLMMNSATEITYLAKNFRNFLETITEGQEVKTMINLKVLGGMIPLK